MAIKRHIPNTITCMNLFSGCVACVMAFKGELLLASLFIYLGAVFDFFDGMVARLLKVSSPIGKELDSLADCITFGMAPGLIMFSFLLTYCEAPCVYVPYVAFLIPVFSALRLAKFNIDERQTSSFIGLPTPANAVFLASSAALFDIEGYNVEALKPFMQNVYVVIAVILVMCYLLVCELPMFSLKFKSLKWVDNKSQFILIGSSVILLAVFRLAAIPMIILLFIFMSVILFFMKKGK